MSTLKVPITFVNVKRLIKGLYIMITVHDFTQLNIS